MWNKEFEIWYEKQNFFVSEIKLAFCSRDKQANCKYELAQIHKKY